MRRFVESSARPSKHRYGPARRYSGRNAPRGQRIAVSDGRQWEVDVTLRGTLRRDRWSFPLQSGSVRCDSTRSLAGDRGHLREGYLILTAQPCTPSSPPARPPESAAVEFRRRSAAGRSATWQWHWPGGRSSGKVSCASRLPEGDRRARRADWIARARGRYVAAAAAAYLTLARGDTAAAIRGLGALPRESCPRCYFDRVVLARLLVDAGRDVKAWDLLQRICPARRFPVRSKSSGACFAGGSRSASASASKQSSLRMGVGMWRRADPELEPYVTEAREGLARLTAEQAVGCSVLLRRAGPGPRAPRPAVPR